MRPHEVRIHVCPLCSAPCEVEGGYDGPYFIWSCDHEHIVRQEHSPAPITLAQYTDPERRATMQNVWRTLEWEAIRADYELTKQGMAERDWRYALGNAGLAQHTRTPLTWTPKDRKARARWRALSSPTKFSETLKAVYLPKVAEHLAQGNMFLAAVEQETGEAIIGIHSDQHRQAFGDE